MGQPIHTLQVCNILENLGGKLARCAPLRYAEVGVEKGRTLAVVLRNLPSVFGWAIDSWAEYDMSDKDHTPGPGSPYGIQDKTIQQENYQTALAALDEFIKGGRCKVLRNTSLEAAAILAPSVKFKCVFLDGDHTAPHVFADCKAWWPMIEPGGVLCGHDFGSWQGVEDGVGKFMDETPDASRVEFKAGYVWAITKPGTLEKVD